MTLYRSVWRGFCTPGVSDVSCQFYKLKTRGSCCAQISIKIFISDNTSAKSILSCEKVISVNYFPIWSHLLPSLMLCFCFIFSGEYRACPQGPLVVFSRSHVTGVTSGVRCETRKCGSERSSFAFANLSEVGRSWCLCSTTLQTKHTATAYRVQRRRSRGRENFTEKIFIVPCDNFCERQESHCVPRSKCSRNFPKN